MNTNPLFVMILVAGVALSGLVAAWLVPVDWPLKVVIGLADLSASALLGFVLLTRGRRR